MTEDNIFMKFLDLDKPKPVNTKITPIEKKVYKRTMGDVYAMAEAQRIFNPGLPSAQPKGPNTSQMDMGTASTLDTSGSWGTPERIDG
jgi:hypothetical protein